LPDLSQLQICEGVTTDSYIEKQATWVLVIVHEKSLKNSAAIQDIVDAYRKRFGKLQTMWFSLPVKPKFFAD
jgi:hypothetical protein